MTTSITTINVNGIRAATKQRSEINPGFLSWLDASGTDIVLMQEIRADTEQTEAALGPALEAGWHLSMTESVVKGHAGVGVLSEESGVHRPGSPLTVVIDPVDGSTNAAHGIPWYACSLCAVDAEGPLVSMVANLASGVTYTAERGGGAWRSTSPDRLDACRIQPSAARSLRP